MLTTKQLAARLPISEQTIRAYARAGAIPFVETPGGHRRYVLEDVLVALERVKQYRFPELDPAAPQRPQLAQQAATGPIRRARPRRRGISLASIAETRREAEPTGTGIPFIGVAGSSRFALGQGSRV